MNQSNPVSWPKSDALPWIGWVFTPMPFKHRVRTAPRCLGHAPAISGDMIFRRCKSWGHDVWGCDARKMLRAEFLYPGNKSPKLVPSWRSFNRPVWDVRCFHFFGLTCKRMEICGKIGVLLPMDLTAETELWTTASGTRSHVVELNSSGVTWVENGRIRQTEIK